MPGAALNDDALDTNDAEPEVEDTATDARYALD
jgi:hypothetical protein